MKIDIMDDRRRIWMEVIHLLFLDQGLETPTTFEWELSDQLFIAARFLKTLSNAELIEFCIGDQQEMDRIITNAEDQEGAHAAHQVLDDLFNSITGVVTNGEERTVPDPQGEGQALQVPEV
jgi:hypothetical protein